MFSGTAIEASPELRRSICRSELPCLICASVGRRYSHRIPALETLHKAWSSRAERSKYAKFAPALKDAAAKVDEYYEKTTHSAAYVLLMLLNPTGKMSYFTKHWPEDLHDDVLSTAETVFKARYLQLNQNWQSQEVNSRSPQRRNQLKADIVEALQCLKCALRHDLLFWEPAPSSLVELEHLDDDDEEVEVEETGDDEEGWDILLLGDDAEDVSDTETDIY
ncbi:uncharacterized protein HD556DRAFT_1471828 [Suillus plorans]|uniref:Uncharacterized protein n=1 Tax=Suillus plorans TaxID=116603 RepID=A0A9P7ABY8_9AGAM|nr:uncharacterized protein HD556DRAFT_1459179 [Suillus plorans]XP_041161396.1 uncharacterized protein HD556DRAFT_1471828 [Suillus plorans]KAG1785330.1 hypothetical protein HD556DRAFT_1459179 [Suillus plorans]KAG1795642.1 hypothetical protein HD556DRAFT_1471828 [Suillus plorans]